MTELLKDLGNFIWQILAFFLPMYLANGFPVIFSRIPVLKRLYEFSIDGGRRWGENFVFGKNKTWFGLFLGMLGGGLGGVLVYWFDSLKVISGMFEYTWENFLVFGMVVGLGAMMGDLVESFVKRRINFGDGKAWFPFDQIDFVIGGWLFSCWFFPWEITWKIAVGALIITPPLHFLANVIAYKLKLKKVWW